MSLDRRSHIKNRINRSRPRKPIFTRLWFWILLLIIILIFTTAYFVLFYSGFQIENIVISGNEKVSMQDLKNVALDKANTGLIKFWNVDLKSKSIFLFNSDNLDKEILKKFPIIQNLKIDRRFPQTISISVTERKPVGSFCGDNNKCFLIDSNGIAYEPLPEASSFGLIVRQVLNNGEVFTGEDVVAQNIITGILDIQKNLKDNFQIDLKEALVSGPIRLNITTNENWKIYFDISPNSEINLQITKLNLLLKGQISQDSRKNLYYIDLRPKDRAIICDSTICGG